MKHFRKLVGPYCFWLFVLTVLPMFLIMIYTIFICYKDTANLLNKQPVIA